MRNLCLLIALTGLTGQMKIKKQVIHITDYLEVNGVEKTTTHREELVFDERGDKISEEEYNVRVDIPKRSIKFIYNDLNQIIYRKETDFRNSFFTETTFKYHAQNDKEAAEMKEVNSKGKLVFLVRREFDNEGRVIKEIWIDNMDTAKIESYSKYLYGGRDQLMEKLSYFQGQPSTRLVYRYDDLGRHIEIRELENSFSRISTMNYTDSSKIQNEWQIQNGIKNRIRTEVFDLKGNPLEWIIYSGSDDKVIKKHEFRYQFDKNGRLQKREEFVGGKLRQEKVYEYEYH